MADKELVNHPDHYGGGEDPYEAIKVMEVWGEAWRKEHCDARPVINLTQTLKYLRRHTQKGQPIEDLAKADWYLSRGRAQVEGVEPNFHMRTPHQQRVEAMMNGFGQAVQFQPVVPNEKTRHLRARLILEECLETIEALGFSLRTDSGPSLEFDDFMLTADKDPNLTEIADGCADVKVVITGTLSACGIPDRPLQEMVDRNNLEKLATATEDEHGKWIKSPDHRPPDIGGLLNEMRR